MKALIYQGPGKISLEERPVPDVTAANEAIVKMQGPARQHRRHCFKVVIET
jgi:hypothetical protein